MAAKFQSKCSCCGKSCRPIFKGDERDSATWLFITCERCVDDVCDDCCDVVNGVALCSHCMQQDAIQQVIA